MGKHETAPDGYQGKHTKQSQQKVGSENRVPDTGNYGGKHEKK